ncbi:MAG: EthD family reductase [Terracidiphilus sp.]|nr:EthD family reductase [Terracidiphilus sp.]
MTTVFVTYTGTRKDHFDCNHYVNVHLPMAERLLGSYGLVSAEAFFPATERSAILAACTLTFRDDEALQTAMAVPEMALLADDLKNFTNMTPVQFRLVADGC